MDLLRLEVRDFGGPLRWRWLLTDEGTGRPLADHQVDLAGPAGEFAAFTDLYRFLRWNAVPDRRAVSEAGIVARVGAWAGRAVLGEAVGSAISAAAPVTVRVVVPAEAGFLLSWPLELAHAGGGPLAARGDVTLVYDLAAGQPGPGADGGGRGAGGAGRALRMLAVFSLPSATSVLALRRERYELARLVRRIGTRQRRRVELSVVQYGVTRERLARVAQAGDGWDVLHLSGHGGRGQFLLEKADGTPDAVDTAGLAGLLAPLRRRVRLAVVSACESAAAMTAETLRWVGLDQQAEQLEQQAAAEIAGAGPVVTGVARALAEGLGCAVVAMRYPVADEFAIAFTEDLYERLLGARDSLPGSHGEPLGSALARAVAAAAGPVPSAARPAISLATPVLLGGDAGLVLDVPRGEPGMDLARVRMERFPPEPERFVGRATAMARAGAALAPGSGQAGVLLHGMAGSGKTACAVELAYRHQDSFAAVAFWKAPDTGDEFGGALAGLAAALDIQLESYGFAMSGMVTTVASAEVFAPRLARLLEDSGLLLVLDNLESLLTPAGTWRDPRWEPLIAAMTGHRGESRVILTSRILPAGLSTSVLPLPVHALDLAESAALARELPGLRGLLHADTGPLRDPAAEAVVAADRDLVRRVLRVVQGHPKLMELADATAADPARLATQLDAAGEAAGGQVLDAFFRDGTTALDATRFLDALTTWTTTTLDALPGPARLMAEFLACTEYDDRNTVIVEANWADLWHRLAQPGDPPAPAPLLDALTAAALIQPSPLPPGDSGPDRDVSFRMHPGVAQAIRAAATPGIQAAADTELAAFWYQVSSHALRREGGEAGQFIVRAGLAAAPYLLRLQDWDTARTLLDLALQRDTSPAVTAAALPALRAIAAATQAPKDLAVLARVLAPADPAEAEALMHGALAQTAASGDFRAASIAAGFLVNLLTDAGRLSEALDLAGQMAEYTSQAGLGPWSQLADQGQRLQILGRMGEDRQVLTETGALQAQMDQLPAARASNDTIEPWNVREATLNTGLASAMALGEWQQALDLNAAILASQQARGAGAHDVASTRFNGSGPLLELGRLDESGQVLADCQQVFEYHSDISLLARVFTVRAVLEGKRGNLAAALAFQQTAIRYDYTRPEPRIIAISHHNLANFLGRSGSDPAAQRAHRLAAALIRQLTGMTHDLANTLRALARELRQDTGSGHLPGTLEEVIEAAEQTEGVRLGELITALQPSTQAAAEALTELLRTAAGIDPEHDDIRDQLQRWEPVITLTIAAAGGDREAAAQLTPDLDKLAQTEDWAVLAAVLRRIADGEHSDSLLDGLDPIDTAIATQALTRITPPPAAPPTEHP
jgi:tetratricopeptide (TPR) repeat protein